MNYLRFFGTTVAAGISGAAGGLLVWVLQGHTLYIRPAGISYSDMVAVFLTGIGLVVSVLAIAVATLAIWGFRHFRTMAQNVAKEVAATNSSQVAESKLNEYWSDSAPQMISVQVKNLVVEIMNNPKQFRAWADEKAGESAAMRDLDDSEDSGE